MWHVVAKIDGKQYIGSAEVHTNAKPGSADATDCWAVAETSAVGHTIALAGLGTVKSICFADELLRGQPQITVIEPAKSSLPALAPAPVPQVDEEKRARLNTLFQIGKGQDLFHHKKGMAQYVSQILDRHIGMDELLDLNEQDLRVIEDALNGTGLEQQESLAEQRERVSS